MSPEICSTGSTSTVTVRETPPPYTDLLKIDYSIRDQIWPTQEELETLNLTNFRLSEFRYRTNVAGYLSGVQLAFENGIESPLFQSDGVILEEALNPIFIESADAVRYVSMKLRFG